MGKDKPIIWVHCLVKNEERWIWFALQSVLPYAKKILVWDSHSTDKTVAVIKTIKDPKISFKEIGEVSQKNFGNVRQKMIEETKADWILILDGDEVWPKKCVEELLERINNASTNVYTFCVKPVNFVGDLNYVHPEIYTGATPYGPKGFKGFYSTRIFRRQIPGLHAGGIYGQETFYNQDNKILIQLKKHVIFLKDIYYWHLSYLPRSSSRLKDMEVMMRWRKRKYELGIPRPKNLEVPQVFYLPRPKIVPNPFYKMSRLEYLNAFLQTPLKKIKRGLTRWQPNQ